MPESTVALKKNCFVSHAQISSDELACAVAKAMKKHTQRVAQLVGLNDYVFNNKLYEILCNVATHYALDTSQVLDVYAKVSKNNGQYVIQTSLTHETSNGASAPEPTLPLVLPFRKAPESEIVLMSMHDLDKELNAWY